MWAECARTVCALDNLDCNGNKKTRYVAFYGKDYTGSKHLRKFGEIGFVTKGDKIKSDLVNRGEACLHLGHADNHRGEVGRFFEIKYKACDSFT